MGFFDTVKLKAGVLAGDAERAGRVTAAQARLVVLQNDVRKAERDLGHVAFELIERGDLASPELADVAARLRAVCTEVRDKEAEIAMLRGTPPTDEAPPPAAADAPDDERREAEARENETRDPASTTDVPVADVATATAPEAAGTTDAETVPTLESPAGDT